MINFDEVTKAAPAMTLPTISFRHTVSSVLLDALRGCAALLVCLQHCRFFFFVDFPAVRDHRALFFVPYVLAEVGHQSVILFFVLSGYLVGGSVLRAVDQGRWSWRMYGLQRGARLWTVLLPALALGGVLDVTAIHFHLAPRLYVGLVPNHLSYNVQEHLGWGILAGNAIFLQGIYVPQFGSNGALWSLANEFWYYILFPLSLLAWRGRYSAPVRVMLGLAFVGTLWFVGHIIFDLFPVWLLGVVLAWVPTRPTPAWIRWAALALYCPFFMVAGRLPIANNLISDYLLGIATFALLFVMLGANQPAGNNWFVRSSRTLSGFSYTLYLVHMPIFILMTALLAGENRWQPDERHLLIAGAVFLVVVLVGYVVSLYTEHKTMVVRDWVLRMAGSV